MQDQKQGVTREQQIVAHATELIRLFDAQRAADRLNDKAAREVAKRAQYPQMLALRKAVHLRPP
ncbi:hypothetical protein CSZ94_17340 [Janthinobacterium sp. ROICE36]|uniref:hypothetical protein n=1 Tax=Janthinobacterium sp. ROICE36 TaxID=2048670 RepID=UPI000C7E9CEB|nr:hypothetical protein [Janthinobacterium sp. ROICE36]PLY41190.1 hypothetical protein CSZ94_17340 [Janthinobacterium sp. ROICE36]